MFHRITPLALALVAGSLLTAAAGVLVQEYKSGVVWPEPKLVTPGETLGAPPSDATILFDGKDLAAWDNGDKWLIADGIATARLTGIQTRASFGDVQLHLEFATPEKVSGAGQGRGNSGIYFMGKYEVQILDSWQNPTYFDGQCASIYKQTPPMVNASRKPGEWQVYDIVFEAPRFNDEKALTRPGYVTVFHNGVLVQNHFELQGSTHYDKPAAYEPHGPAAPISLQYHGNPMRFRNIWVRPFVALTGKKPA